jgi:hypothetical protein
MTRCDHPVEPLQHLGSINELDLCSSLPSSVAGRYGPKRVLASRRSILAIPYRVISYDKVSSHSCHSKPNTSRVLDISLTMQDRSTSPTSHLARVLWQNGRSANEPKGNSHRCHSKAIPLSTSFSVREWYAFAYTVERNEMQSLH